MPAEAVKAALDDQYKDLAKDGDGFKDKISSFAGFNFKPSKFGISAEGINLGRGNGLSRFNASTILEFTEGLQFVLNFENITREKLAAVHATQDEVKIERSLSIVYRSAF